MIAQQNKHTEKYISSIKCITSQSERVKEKLEDSD